MYLAIKWAKDKGEKSIITGDGADELFAGYNFLLNKSKEELEEETNRICKIMHFPTQKIGEAMGVKIESPFLDEKVIDMAKEIPVNLKVGTKEEKRYGKWILRKTFEKTHSSTHSMERQVANAGGFRYCRTNRAV